MTSREVYGRLQASVFKGRVSDIKYNISRKARAVQGTSLRNVKHATVPRDFGLPGTYRVGYPGARRKLLMIVKIGRYGKQGFDVRALALKANDRIRITTQLVQLLRGKLVGRELRFGVGGNGFEPHEPNDLRVL